MNDQTKCIVCGDDYGDLSDECLSFNVCADCRDVYDTEDLLEKSLFAEEGENL